MNSGSGGGNYRRAPESGRTEIFHTVSIQLKLKGVGTFKTKLAGLFFSGLDKGVASRGLLHIA